MRLLSFRKNPWKTTFFLVTFALFLFVAVSGLITFFWPSTHFFIQFNVLFHTGVGIVAGLLMSYFYLRHWLVHRANGTERRVSRSYRWIGHGAGILIIGSLLTGVVMVFTGVSGKVAWVYWSHIVVSLAGCGGLGHHLIVAYQRQKGRRDAARLGVRQDAVGKACLEVLARTLAERSNQGELLAFCGRININYRHLPGNSKADKMVALINRLDDPQMTARFLSLGQRLYPGLAWAEARVALKEPVARPPKKTTALPIKRGLPVTVSLLLGAVLLTVGLGLRYRSSWPATIDVPGYTYPYGDNPFAPSQPTTPDMAFINEALMADSQSCGQTNCHTNVYEQWAESVHRYSTDNPWFEQALMEMVATEGPNATRYCGGCHDPLALLSGKMDVSGPVRNSHPNEGISCIACHSITKINDLTGTSAYTFTPPDQYLFWEQEGAIPEYLNYLLIRLKPGPHSDTFMKPFYKEPEYCSLCHKQFIDEQTNEYHWLRLQDQYDDWQLSGFSHESVMVWYPAAERQTCNDCHMQSVPSYDLGGQVDEVLSHRYIAANTAIPFYYGHETQLAETVAWLEREEIAVDIFALTQSEHATIMAPLNRTSPPLRPGETYLFDVMVTNHIAHGFPTGPLDLYEAWLEFQVMDGRGQIVYSSGLIDEAGVLDPNAHQFIAPPITGEGEWIRKHDLWNEYGVAFNNSIPAQETQVVHYEVTIPETAAAPFVITSRVRYRRFNRWYTEWAVASDAPRFPIVDLSLDMVVIGENGVIGQPLPEDYLRFNQYGIGLLKQGLYEDAETAFTQSVSLNPAYVDGYVNVALIHLQTDALLEAEDWLGRAQMINPMSWRARAYLGVLRQRQGRFTEAIQLLQGVWEQFPRDQKVLFELGKSFYLAAQYEQAIEVFQQTLVIDPDLAAVYEMLALCYEGLGQDAAAAAAQSEFLRLQKLPIPEGRAHFFENNAWAQAEASPYHTH